MDFKEKNANRSYFQFENPVETVLDYSSGSCLGWDLAFLWEQP